MRQHPHHIKSLFLISLISLAVGLRAQTRNVTFTVNSCTIPDTVSPTYPMQIRGNLLPLTWGNDTGGILRNIGGDYWSWTALFRVGDTIRFKIFAGYPGIGGWEQDIVPDPPTLPDPNRAYIVANRDTVLPVQFFNSGSSSRPQYFRPWAEVPDSFMSVYFRVNVNGLINRPPWTFDNFRDTLGVRGNGPQGGDLSWLRSFHLIRETTSTNGGFNYQANGFWSGRVRIPKRSVAEGERIEYKFVIDHEGGRIDTEQVARRSFPIPIGKQDTTLRWVYFDNRRETSPPLFDSIGTKFRVDMARARETLGFSFGDTLVVRAGYFGTVWGPVREKRLVRQGTTTMYEATDTLLAFKGQWLDYQYYLLKNQSEIREDYFNFTFNGYYQSESERRQILVPRVPGRVTVVVNDTTSTLTDARRQPVFPNSRRLARDVLVSWEVDLRPAYYQLRFGHDTLVDMHGTFNVVEADSIFLWGVRINGPATNGWQGWGLPLFGDINRTMWDDGPGGGQGDRVAGDSIYTRQIRVSPTFPADSGTRNQVGQVFQFGIRGGDNEGGRNWFGNSHKANINDSSGTCTIYTQWGSLNPRFYNKWDYDHRLPRLTAVPHGNQRPTTFALEQSYPNPFNPSTTISYSIVSESFVSLKVYNLLGQEVATLVNERQNPASYMAKFDARRLASGVYLYRLRAGEFVSIKKMVLLR